MSRRNLSRRAVYGLLVAGLLAVALVGWLGVISPKRSESARLDSELLAVEQTIAVRRLALGAAAGGGSRNEFGDLVRLAKAFPPEVDAASLLVELDLLASASGVELESITPQAPVAAAGTGVDVIPIDLAVEGEYTEISRFLGRLRSQVTVGRNRLRATGRLYSVDHIDLNEGTRKFPQLRAALKLNAYRFAGGATAATPEATTTSPPAGTQAAPATP